MNAVSVSRSWGRHEGPAHLTSNEHIQYLVTKPSKSMSQYIHEKILIRWHYFQNVDTIIDAQLSLKRVNSSIPYQFKLWPLPYIFFFVLLIRSCHTAQRFTGVHLIVFTLGIPLSMETTSHQSYTAWPYGTIWCWGWGKAEPAAQQWIPPAKGQWRVALIVSLLVAWTGCLTKY